MDENPVKPPQEPQDNPRTMMEMMEMMETMCCSGRLGPADMCRRMRSTGTTPDAEAQPAAENDVSRGYCGPRSRRAPERPERAARGTT